jgi:hypothetical protein
MTLVTIAVPQHQTAASSRWPHAQGYVTPTDEIPEPSPGAHFFEVVGPTQANIGFQGNAHDPLELSGITWERQGLRCLARVATGEPKVRPDRHAIFKKMVEVPPPEPLARALR